MPNTAIFKMFFAFVFIHFSLYIYTNKKSAPTEVSARKTQIPTVAKQFLRSTDNCTHINGIRIFAKFNYRHSKK